MLQTHSIRISVDSEFCLTEITTSDKPSLVDQLNDRQIYEQTLRIPFPYTEADADGFLSFLETATDPEGRPLHFAIREPAGHLIGTCGFQELIVGHRAEIGYWLGRPWWGQGIATNVVRAACKHAFSQWKLVRITAQVFELNQASTRVLEKNGFVNEGLLRKHQWKAGEFRNSRLFALVR